MGARSLTLKDGIPLVAKTMRVWLASTVMSAAEARILGEGHWLAGLRSSLCCGVWSRRMWGKLLGLRLQERGLFLERGT